MIAIQNKQDLPTKGVCIKELLAVNPGITGLITGLTRSLQDYIRNLYKTAGLQS